MAKRKRTPWRRIFSVLWYAHTLAKSMASLDCLHDEQEMGTYHGMYSMHSLNSAWSTYLLAMWCAFVSCFLFFSFLFFTPQKLIMVIIMNPFFNLIYLHCFLICINWNAILDFYSIINWIKNWSKMKENCCIFFTFKNVNDNTFFFCFCWRLLAFAFNVIISKYMKFFRCSRDYIIIKGNINNIKKIRKDFIMDFFPPELNINVYTHIEVKKVSH